VPGPEGGRERPTAFESKAGDQVILITLGKAKKKE
jgi:hypothetical protein